MDPKTLIKDIDHLVSLPDICIKVNQMMGAANYSASQVANIIIQDADISARLLRLANSALYGQQARVETLSRAVALLGADELRNLVIATSAMRTFTNIPEDLVNMEDYWRHSVTTGVMSHILAKRCNALHSERLFVMGVLHDIGRLVIYLTLPEKAIEILRITGGDNWVLPETEAKVLGFTNMEVGAELIRSWGLPESFAAVAGHHHYPDQATEYRLEVSLVHIAKAIANGEMVGLSIDEMTWAMDPSAWDATGLNPESVALMVDEMLLKSNEVVSLILSPLTQRQTN